MSQNVSSIIPLEQSDSLTDLTLARIEFDKKCPIVTKDGFNTMFKSKYADLASLLRVVTPVLADVGLIVLQYPVTADDDARTEYLITRLQHKSGEFIQIAVKLCAQPQLLYRTGDQEVRAITAQALGSAITYARRYALQSLLSLCVDEDDDGNAASAHNQQDRSAKPASNSKSAPKDEPKAEPKAAEPANPKTDAEVEDIKTRIANVAFDKCKDTEQWLANQAGRGLITREQFGACLFVLLNRWVAVAPRDQVMTIGQKFAPYVGQGVLTSAQQVEFLTTVENKLQEESV